MKRSTFLYILLGLVLSLLADLILYVFVYANPTLIVWSLVLLPVTIVLLIFMLTRKG